MIKFTSKVNRVETRPKFQAPVRSGLISLLPTNAPAQKLLFATVLAIFLAILSFSLVSISHSKNSWLKFPNQIVESIFPYKIKQNVNSTLVSLPGGQFLPSLSYPLNILLMGVDSNGKNTQRFVATRSDTMMLVSIDPQKNQASIISIPRDSRVAIPGHGKDKINSAHALGGPQLAVETVKQALSVPMDRSIVVDEDGFKRLIDEVGPVDVLIEKKMSYSDHSASLAINLEPGLQRLDAKQAEGYIRFRHDAKGDIGRIERQQWFARQITNKFADPQLLVKLPQLLKIANDCVVTDMSIDEMVRLVGFACHTNPGKIRMAMLPGKPEIIHGASFWLPEIEATTAIISKLVNLDPRAEKEMGSALTYSEQSSEQPVADLGSAMAYTRSSYQPTEARDQFTVSIRYPEGCEQEANSLELMLEKAGIPAKNKYKADLSDCQHEEVVENTVHSLNINLESVHKKLPCIKDWPTVVNIDPQTSNDLTLVITPNSKFSTLAAIESNNLPQ